VPQSAGTLDTRTPLFVGMLIGVILILVGLTYFPRSRWEFSQRPAIEAIQTAREQGRRRFRGGSASAGTRLRQEPQRS